MPNTLAPHMDFIPAGRSARGWICDTFGWRVGEMTCAGDVRLQQGALRRVLHTGAGRAMLAVPRGAPDEFVGWAVELEGALLFAYVREEFRQGGIGQALIARAVASKPAHVAYWTDDVEAMVAHGVPLVYDIRAYQALLAFVRGPGRRWNRAVPVAA